MAVFTCYDTVNSKWGNDNTSEAVIDAMCPMRQTLYRTPRAANNSTYERLAATAYPARL